MESSKPIIIDDCCCCCCFKFFFTSGNWLTDGGGSARVFLGLQPTRCCCCCCWQLLLIWLGVFGVAQETRLIGWLQMNPEEPASGSKETNERSAHKDPNHAEMVSSKRRQSTPNASSCVQRHHNKVQIIIIIIIIIILLWGRDGIRYNVDCCAPLYYYYSDNDDLSQLDDELPIFGAQCSAVQCSKHSEVIIIIITYRMNNGKR